MYTVFSHEGNIALIIKAGQGVMLCNGKVVWDCTMPLYEQCRADNHVWDKLSQNGTKYSNMELVL